MCNIQGLYLHKKALNITVTHVDSFVVTIEEIH